MHGTLTPADRARLRATTAAWSTPQPAGRKQTADIIAPFVDLIPVAHRDLPDSEDHAEVTFHLARRRKAKRWAKRQEQKLRKRAETLEPLPDDATPEQRAEWVLKEIALAARGRGTEPLPDDATPEQRAEWEDRKERRDHAIEQAVDRNNRIAEWERSGFVWQGGDVCDVWVAPFTEKGKRSPLHHNLRMFVASLPKVRRPHTPEGQAVLTVGSDKGYVWEPDVKLLGLLEPYVSYDSHSCGIIHCDIDADFADIWTLLELLNDEIGLNGLPCLPHIVTAARASDGRIHHPHLIWLLPHGKGVRTTEDGLKAPKRALKRVRAWITKLLLGIGADPGSLRTLKTKNPLSPTMMTACPEDSTYPSLSDWLRHVGSDVVDANAVSRAQAAVQSGGKAKHSNHAFDVLRIRALDWVRDRDHETERSVFDARRADVDTFAAEAMADLLPGALDDLASNGKRSRVRLVTSVLRCCCRYAVTHYDPGLKTKFPKHVGACREACSKVDGVKKRQGVGGAYSASLVAGKSADKIRRAVAALEAAGETVTQTAVAKKIGLRRETVCRWWPKLFGVNETTQPTSVRECDIRSKIKRVLSPLATPEENTGMNELPVCCPSKSNIGMTNTHPGDTPCPSSTATMPSSRPAPAGLSVLSASGRGVLNTVHASLPVDARKPPSCAVNSPASSPNPSSLTGLAMTSAPSCGSLSTGSSARASTALRSSALSVGSSTGAGTAASTSRQDRRADPFADLKVVGEFVSVGDTVDGQFSDAPLKPAISAVSTSKRSAVKVFRTPVWALGWKPSEPCEDDSDGEKVYQQIRVAAMRDSVRSKTDQTTDVKTLLVLQKSERDHALATWANTKGRRREVEYAFHSRHRTDHPVWRALHGDAVKALTDLDSCTVV